MPNGTWLRGGQAGNWNVATDWVSSVIASGAGSTANLTSNLSAIYSVFVPAGYAVTIGNIVFSDGGADGTARYLQGGGSSNTQTGGTLTLDSGGATQPVLNLIQAAYINSQSTRARMILAGTNGFNKTGNQSLFIGQANGVGHTISGTITASQGALYLGLINSGITDVLPAATSFVANGGAILLAGTGGYTETRPFNSGAIASSIYNYAPGTITFNNTAWRTFTGYAQIVADANSGTTVTSNFLTHFPVAATALLGQCNISNSTVTMIFSHDYAVTYPGLVGLYASTATSGGKFVLQDNGTASTDYQGTAYRWQTSNTSSSMALDLSGTNTACTYSGLIRNNTGTAAGTLLLSKSGAGTWTVSGGNDYSGLTTVSGGTLIANNSSTLVTPESGSPYYTSSLGTNAGGITISGGTLELREGTSINKGTSTVSLTSVGGADAIRIPVGGGNSTLTFGGGALASSAPTVINTAIGTSLSLVNSGAITGGSIGAFGSANSFANGRHVASSSILQNGNVLVAGGQISDVTTATNTVRLYSPSTNTWTSVNSMSGSRSRHCQTTLQDGRVLVTGGQNASGVALNTAELYNLDGTWTSAGTFTGSRQYHQQTLLQDGRVLVSGGQSGVNTATIFNPSTNLWSNTSNMLSARGSFCAVLLTKGPRAGHVLAIGGLNGSNVAISTCETWNPSTGMWESAPSMSQARFRFRATPLQNGNILVTGGFSSGTTAISSVEEYDPVENTWTTRASFTARGAHAAVLLQDGRVFVAAGRSGLTHSTSSQIWDSITNTWVSSDALVTGRSYPIFEILQDGSVLIAGGANETSFFATAERFTVGVALTKNGAGGLNLGSRASTFLGGVEVNDGATITVGSSCISSTSSPLGSDGSQVKLNGTLKYDGSSSGIISRTIGLNGSTPALESSGAGSVQIDSLLVHSLTSAKTLTLKGTNEGENIISSDLSDSTGTTSLAKEGAGKWSLTSLNIDYTGNTTVSGGTLDLGGINRTLSGNISISGGTLLNGSSSNTLNAGTVSLSGGTLRANLVGSGKSLLVTGGDNTVYPTAGANSFSGTSSVYQGATLSLKTDTSPATSGAGKVLGDANVTVLGEVKTGGSATQKGQVRWGGNLSLGLNSKIHIGAA
jgi:autotransporter-associated beta strand protein